MIASSSKGAASLPSLVLGHFVESVDRYEAFKSAFCKDLLSHTRRKYADSHVTIVAVFTQKSVSYFPASNLHVSTLVLQSGRSSEVTLATAMVGGGIGVGYLACRMISYARKGREGQKDPEDFPMFDMADIARRAVPRKKSFLYTRSGDKGTSQVCQNRQSQASVLHERGM